MAKAIQQKGADRPNQADFQSCVQSDIAFKWDDLGRQLLDKKYHSRIQIIEADNRSVKVCCGKLFAFWLRVDPDATWIKLIEAMEKVPELKTIAEDVKKMLQGSRKRPRENNASGSSKRSSGSTQHGTSMDASKDFTDHDKPPESENSITEKQKKPSTKGTDSIKSEQQPMPPVMVNSPVEPHVEKLKEIDIEEEFKAFVSKVHQYWSSNVKDLIDLSLQDANTSEGVSYSDELFREIKEASSVDAFFSILAKNPTHYSWINTQVLEKIAPVGKKWYEEYVSAISSKPLVEILDAIPTLPIDEKVYIIVKNKWDQDVNDTTVGQLFEHMLAIASILKIERSSFFVTGISKGSIEVFLAFLKDLETEKFAILVGGFVVITLGTFAIMNKQPIILNRDGLQTNPPSNESNFEEQIQ